MADSYNEIYGLGTHAGMLMANWDHQDNAANSIVDDRSTNNNDATYATATTADRSRSGPTSWLPLGLNYNNATNDYARVNNPLAGPASNDFTMVFWVVFSSYGPVQFIYSDAATAGDLSKGHALQVSGGTFFWYLDSADANFSYTPPAAGNWYQWVISKKATDNYANFYQDSVPTAVNQITAKAIVPDAGDRFDLGANIGTFTGYLSGAMSGFAYINAALTDAEVIETYKGPEPLNLTAPVVTGGSSPPQVGETLNATGGTWNNQNNGPTVVTFQWHQADDNAGTNPQPIVGATASSYQIQAGDAGKHLGVLARGSNDGDHDSAEDTFSNWTEAVGGGAPEVDITPEKLTFALSLAEPALTQAVTVGPAKLTFSLSLGEPNVTVGIPGVEIAPADMTFALAYTEPTLTQEMTVAPEDLTFATLFSQPIVSIGLLVEIPGAESRLKYYRSHSQVLEEHIAMGILLCQTWTVSQGDQESAAIDYTDWLDADELLQGTPTATEPTGDVSITNVRVSSSDLEILGRTVPAGAAVQMDFAGQLSGKQYTFDVGVSTNKARTVNRQQLVIAK